MMPNDLFPRPAVPATAAHPIGHLASAAIALKEIREFLNGPDGVRIDKVMIVCFDDYNYKAYLKLFSS